MTAARASDPPTAKRRRVLRGLAAAALLAAGIGIGSRIAAPNGSVVTRTVVTTVPSTTTTRPTGNTRSRVGAVAAAAVSVELLEGPALLDPTRIRELVDRLAASSARDGLARAYAQGAAEARSRLATSSVPTPVVILRATPVGYRIDSFSPSAARVSIWRVGIVGSGATVQPQQSWRTETVSLVWERGGWRVVSFTSAPGPTPPLPAAAGASTAADLFAEIPRFQEFSRALP